VALCIYFLSKMEFEKGTFYTLERKMKRQFLWRQIVMEVIGKGRKKDYSSFNQSSQN
jgi:hypothetical protein